MNNEDLKDNKVFQILRNTICLVVRSARPSDYKSAKVMASRPIAPRPTYCYPVFIMDNISRKTEIPLYKRDLGTPLQNAPIPAIHVDNLLPVEELKITLDENKPKNGIENTNAIHDNIKCCICYIKTELQILKCKHLVCKTCLKFILLTPGKKCPVCWKKIRESAIKIYNGEEINYAKKHAMLENLKKK